MPALRTQLYLAAEQRRRIDQVAARDGVTLAEVVRRALDHYLNDTGADPTAALDATFGADPEICPPSREEWTRG